jgi:glycosyltransferase involved in cell wall biosynthesis
MQTAPRSVLIVEPRAHFPNGHFPRRCAELATAYAELGYRVELLTSLGWALDAEHPRPPFAVRRWRPSARRLRRRYHDPWLFTALLLAEVRACVRTMTPRPELVVLLAWDEIPALIAAVAPLRERWLVNQFRGASELPSSAVVDRIARWRERRRRAAGGAVRIVVAHERRRATWVEVAAFLDPVVAPVAGVRAAAPAPDAREQLGVPATGKVALLFGEGFLKRRDVVLDAFAQLDDWTLVLGGPVADDLSQRPRVVMFPGVVDNATRDRLFAAADLVVLSFAPGYRNESGTLFDAIGAGTPVVCCDDAAVADTIVTRFRLGTTFAAGDARSLVDAVRDAPTSIEPEDLEAARREHSNRAVVRRQLLVMGIVT